MTMQVKTQAANLFGNGSTTVTKKSTQTGSGFEAMISNNMRQYQNINSSKDMVHKASIQRDDAEAKKSNKDKINARESELQPQEAISDSKKTELKAGNAKEDGIKLKDNQFVNETPMEDVDDKETQMTELAALLQAVSEVVMQVLNLTEEEFNQLLEDQGMNVADLLDSQGLQQLLLASKGESDILSVLTDENLAKQMKELLEQVEGLITGADLGLTKEQIEELITQDELKGNGASVTDKGTSDKQTEEILTKDQSESLNTIQGSLDKQQGNSTMEGNKDNLTDPLLVEDTQANSSVTKQESVDQEQGAEDHFQTFIDNLVKSTGDTEMDPSVSMGKAAELRDIANQIIERIRISIKPEQTKMELQLNPENLGKVNLTVQSKNGLMTAQFVVQNEIAKEAIESQMHILRENFTNQGIKVEAIEVTVANYTFDPNNQNQSQGQAEADHHTSGKKITLEEAFSMLEDPEETITDEISIGVGSQVDYTA